MHPLRTQTEGFRTDNSDPTQSQVWQLDHLDPTQTPQSPIALHRHHTMKKRVRGKKTTDFRKCTAAPMQMHFILLQTTHLPY